MEKKDLDWGNLSFAYMHTDYSYVCNYKDGAWEEGGLTSDHTVTLSECAGLLHYCQEVFEGLKAYTTENGDIVCFRPDMNAQRMYDSAARLEMPSFPKDKFVEAVEMVVRANAAWVPPFGSGATLYIRPFMFATGDVIGVKPATEYQFRILVTPVGPYSWRQARHAAGPRLRPRRSPRHRQHQGRPELRYVAASQRHRPLQGLRRQPLP